MGGCGVTTLRGEVSRQLGAKEYHKIRSHPRSLLGKTQANACLCSGEKQQRIEQEGSIYIEFLEGGAFQSGLDWWDSLA